MAEPLPEQPRSYGHYDVESILGRGAMGMVYLARDRRIGRKVALKTVHVDEKFDDDSEAREFYSRLQREAELCGSLQHPNIVTLYEPGYDNGTIAWLATEYVDGETLRDKLKKRKPLPLMEALRIGEDILRGLAFAHAKGIVHRDIKPANILLTSAGEAKIADFGIARPVDSNLTAVGEMLGTPSYMSPEQVKCTTVTSRSDVFSAGAVIYEMVTGLKAFGAADVQSILRNVVDATPRRANEVNAEVPPALADLLSRMMAKTPEERLASAAIAADELRDIRQLVGAAGEVVEELPKNEAGVSTMAARAAATPAAAAESQPTTSVGVGSGTPPVGGLKVTRHPVLRRRIPAAVFFISIALVAAIVGGTAYAIKARTNETPTVTHSKAQLDHFKAKREALANARILMMKGDYEGSFKAYNDYLARFGDSPAAITGRADAARALDAEKAKSKVTVVAAKKPAPKKTTTTAAPAQPKTEEKKPGLFRRIFGRGDKKKP